MFLRSAPDDPNGSSLKAKTCGNRSLKTEDLVACF
jgi:hypothetical protein